MSVDLGSCTVCGAPITERTVGGPRPPGADPFVIEVCEAEHEVKRVADKVEIMVLLGRSFGFEWTREEAEAQIALALKEWGSP